MSSSSSPTLHPRGVHHLALTTTDIKKQLQFFNDVLGMPLKALYWMHGVEGYFHGFLELGPESYVAFVAGPGVSGDIQYGVTHSGSPMTPVTGGTMQHVAFAVDNYDDLLAMRNRVRSRGVHVMGPLDHGFCQSIYFAGPESLSLEISCGRNIDARAWIDPEVVKLCGISDEELERLKSPEPYQAPEAPVPQPPMDTAEPRMHLPPEQYQLLLGSSDEKVWELLSESTPPVAVDPAAEAVNG